LVYITAGNNIGRVGTITNLDRHPGSFNVVHIKDSRDKVFATRETNIFIIGKGKKAWITLPKGNGLYLDAIETKRNREENKNKKN
jgi:small subunit ribosomal protein S4e